MKMVWASVLYLICPFVMANSYSNEVALRIDKISQSYLGLPYIVDPLGEGEGYDKDPLFRFDGFDCVTYVETVLAEALAGSNEQFLPILNQIRYKNSQIDFKTRNHFTSIDWIVNNQQIIKDITEDLFPQEHQISRTWIDRSAWFLRNHKMVVQENPKYSILPYLSIEAVQNNPDLLSRIPHGAIISIVRPNWNLKDKIGTNLDVSHQGFAILKDDVLYFRHAGISAKQVVEEPLIQYLQKMTSVASVGGINILEIR